MRVLKGRSRSLEGRVARWGGAVFYRTEVPQPPPVLVFKRPGIAPSKCPTSRSPRRRRRLKSVPLRGASFERSLECTRRSDGRSFVERRSSGPPWTSRICSPDRPLTCGDGQLVNFLRYVAVRVGHALLYQQFEDLFVVARRFRASRRAAACGHSQTAETGTFRRARFKHGAYEFLEPPHAPCGCPVPRAGTESALKAERSRGRVGLVP